MVLNFQKYGVCIMIMRPGNFDAGTLPAHTIFWLDHQVLGSGMAFVRRKASDDEFSRDLGLGLSSEVE